MKYWIGDGLTIKNLLHPSHAGTDSAVAEWEFRRADVLLPSQQTSPPSSAVSRKPKLFSAAILSVLCSLSYLFGAWQHNPGGGSISSVVNLAAPISCSTSNKTAAGIAAPTTKLDFTGHHAGDESAAAAIPAVNSYPPCGVKYAEYTPCERQDLYSARLRDLEPTSFAKPHPESSAVSRGTLI